MLCDMPPPLKEGLVCPDCKGTGANIEKTLKRTSPIPGYIICWSCNGNGLDPAKYFTWKKVRSDA